MPFVTGCDRILVREPKPADVAGIYHLTAGSREFLKTGKGYATIPDATIELRSDGTLIVRDLPDCAVNGFGNSSGKFVSGRGTWKIEKAYVGYGLSWEVLPGDSLRAGGYVGPFVALRRRSPPYELELTVGDPDAGETIRYQRSAG